MHTQEHNALICALQVDQKTIWTNVEVRRITERCNKWAS